MGETKTTMVYMGTKIAHKRHNWFKNHLTILLIN